MRLEREEGGGREREGNREGEREGNINVREKRPSVAFPYAPDWESNLQTFSLWVDAPTNRAHQPGQLKFYFIVKSFSRVD